MYEAHWGLTQAPFQNVPDPAFFCPLAGHQAALEQLLYVVQSGKGGAVLTAEAGCGKSTLSRLFLLQLKQDKYDVGLVINPAFTPEDLLYDIALQLDLAPPCAQRAALFRLLTDRLLATAQEDRATVLIIDEAHLIRDEAVWEDLRLLLNLQLNDRNLLCLILMGLPALRATLDRVRPLRQRLACALKLAPLSEAETAFYVEFRLTRAGAAPRRLFTEGALRAIHQETAGVPREINRLCDLCLYEGWKRKAAEIDAALVRAVVAADRDA